MIDTYRLLTVDSSQILPTLAKGYQCSLVRHMLCTHHVDETNTEHSHYQSRRDWAFHMLSNQISYECKFMLHDIFKQNPNVKDHALSLNPAIQEILATTDAVEKELNDLCEEAKNILESLPAETWTRTSTGSSYTTSDITKLREVVGKFGVSRPTEFMSFWKNGSLGNNTSDLLKTILKIFNTTNNNAMLLKTVRFIYRYEYGYYIPLKLIFSENPHLFHERLNPSDPNDTSTLFYHFQIGESNRTREPSPIIPTGDPAAPGPSSGR